MTVKFARYMMPSEFARELETLRAYRADFVGNGLLEQLEEIGLIVPHLRIHYPDPVARRLWLERNPGLNMKGALEPDGPRWDAAVDLENALYRWQNFSVYGASPHPCDDPDPRFQEFIRAAEGTSFEAWMGMRVDVSNDQYPELFDDGNVKSFYTSWQLLLAAEVADIGVLFRLNLADENIWRASHEAFDQGKRPGDRASFSLLPVHAMRDFARYRSVLDAVVWFAEETNRALTGLVKNEGGRFRLSLAQSTAYDQARWAAAGQSASRYGLTKCAVIGLCRFLAERWASWHRDGRPLIADAYKEFLGKTIVMARLLYDLSFAEMRESVGQRGGWFKPILDVIWPNWTEEEKTRLCRTLAVHGSQPANADLTQDELRAFADFIESNHLEAFFWRLRSFEEHAFHGNDFAIEAMRSDLQGIAVAVEHVARALGGTEGQLYEMFKELWQEPQVLALLKRNDVTDYARQARLAGNWPALKTNIENLRAVGYAGRVVADLVMAHRIRGGVHTLLPEDDQFELERLFVCVMRAGALTFAEVCRQTMPAQPSAVQAGP